MPIIYLTTRIPSKIINKYNFFLPFAGDGAVSGHALWRHFEVRIAAVKKALSALRQRLQHESGAGRAAALERTARTDRTIFHIETEKKKLKLIFFSFLVCCKFYKLYFINQQKNITTGYSIFLF